MVADLMAGVVAVVLLLFIVAALRMSHSATTPEAKSPQPGRSLPPIISTDTNFGTPEITFTNGILEFGVFGNFATNSSYISPANADRIRAAVIAILSRARSPEGQRWIKQFVVIGYADETGDYLYNLNKSLERSQRLLCELMSPGPGATVKLNDAERDMVVRMFLASGYSFNSLQSTQAKSRRVEIRLEYWAEREQQPEPRPLPVIRPGKCGIGANP